MLARILIVQPGLVGEDHQQIGLDQVGHERGQRVVVAETDFFRGHGIVFVDHRHDAQAEQRAQGAAALR